MMYNALPVGKKTPKTARSPLDFVTLPKEDQATDIGNVHKTFGKNRVCGSGDILVDRQTDRQTDRHTDVLITILRNYYHGRSN